MDQNTLLKSPDQTKADTKSATAEVVKVRQVAPADVPFIFNSWLKSYRGSKLATEISSPVYFDLHHKLVEKLLLRCKVLVACNVEDENQVYGYLCYEVVENVPVMHFAYVKHIFRGTGICNKILAAADISKNTGAYYSHKTGIVDKAAKGSKWVYCPYLAYGTEGA